MSMKEVDVRGLPLNGDTNPFATKFVDEKKIREAIDTNFIFHPFLFVNSVLLQRLPEGRTMLHNR